VALPMGRRRTPREVVLMKPQPVRDDRWLWLAVRRALLMICRAIETRYGTEEGEKAA
jgi:hypothetical protein